jgi:hypothetical protein
VVEHLEARAVGHHQVGDDEVEGRRGGVEALPGLAHAGGELDDVAHAPEQHVHHLTERGSSSTTRMRAGAVIAQSVPIPRAAKRHFCRVTRAG